ncbi:MAG: GGDEF domain-containing protein [Spirochaetes bacterium]|nr:GGDEF domain-containing protein [Spirochaetota bacterium]
MSIKYKIIIFIVVLLILSLGITILHLTNKYWPVLQDEIINRISLNLENNNSIVADNMTSDSPLESLNSIFLTVLDNNNELMYIKVMDLFNKDRYALYTRNTVIFESGHDKLQVPRNEIFIGEGRVRPVPENVYSNVYHTNENLYIINNYSKQLKEYADEFNAINSNFNSFLQFRKNAIRSNNKISMLFSKNKKNPNKRAEKELIDLINRELMQQFGFIRKLNDSINYKINFFEKKMDIIYTDIIAMSKAGEVRKIKDKNTEIIHDLKRMEIIILKNLRAFKRITKPRDIIRTDNMILAIKKQINRVNRNLELIDKRMDSFIEAKLYFQPKTEKDYEVFDQIKLIKLYRKITWGKNIVGYYEIGISNDEIWNKIKPTIIESSFSSIGFIIISIIAGLLLALYIVYPIHKLDKGADEMLKDLKFRISLKRKDEFGKFANTFNHLSDQLIEELSKYERLYKEATEDQLTKLMVRRYFMGTLKSELENAKKENRPTTLFITDIDHFKNFNDTHGHQTGDRVLAKVAEVILKNTRQNRVRNDIAGRYGGEEFALLLPDTDKEDAMQSAERIRKQIEAMTARSTKNKELKVTISIGVATSLDSDITPKELISRADKALYQSKEKGRNMVTYG